MKTIVEGRGYEIIHKGQFLDATRTMVGHEEDFLIPALEGRSGMMKTKSLAIIGVPQSTICARCFSNYSVGSGQKGAGFIRILNSGNRTRVAVSGYNLAAIVP